MDKKKDVIEKYYVQTTKGDKYIENFEIIEYNMDKIMGYWYNQDKLNVNKYKHLIMLDLDKDNLKELSNGDELVMDFKDRITKLNEQETFQSAMTYEEDQKLILNTEKHASYDEGKIEGIREGKIEIVKNLLLTNLSLEEIAKVTGLSMNEIIKLSNNIGN